MPSLAAQKHHKDFSPSFVFNSNSYLMEPGYSVDEDPYGLSIDSDVDRLQNFQSRDEQAVKYRFPCRDYEKGMCLRGSLCRFYHDPSKGNYIVFH